MIESEKIEEQKTIWKCSKRDDENVNEYYCCMYCMEEAEFMVKCWNYNMVLIDDKWVGRWDGVERYE